MPAEILVVSLSPGGEYTAASRGATSGRRTISSQSKRSPGSTSHPFAGCQRSWKYAPISRVVQRERPAPAQTRSGARAFRLRADNSPARALVLVICDVVQIESRLQIVPPGPVPGRQIQSPRFPPDAASARSGFQSSCPPPSPA